MRVFCVRAVRASLVIAGVAALTVIAGCSAKADDVFARRPAAAAVPARPFDWNGFYFGGHMGYGRGTVTSTVFDPGAGATGGSVGRLFLGPHAGNKLVLP